MPIPDRFAATRVLGGIALAVAALAAGVAGARDVPDALRPSGRFDVHAAGAAKTPPMGWNPWNAFRTEVDQDKILSVVDVIERRGLRDAGYRYINLDDGWWLRRRADGGIEVRTSMFPIAKGADGGTGFRAWTDQLHARGFKAGIYTDVGRNACSQAFDLHSPNLPVGDRAEREIGLEGFEYSDLKTMFQDWGFDYVKVDACGLADFGADSQALAKADYEPMRPLIVRDDPAHTERAAVETRYARVDRLLAALNPDGDYVLSICTWGQAGVRDWGGRHGHSWRTSPDIEPTWHSMLHNLDTAARRELYAGPGRWNDPDMLAIGLGEFDADHLDAARTHFSAWAVLAAPLLMGFDLTRAPDALIELLSNPEVIAVNQDPAGNQGNLVVDDGAVQVLVKPLAARGERAVLLMNRGDAPAVASVDAARMTLRADAPLRVRDLWRHADLPDARGPLRFELPARGSVLLRVAGTPAAGDDRLLGEMTGRIHVAADGVAADRGDLTDAADTPRADFAPGGAPLRIAGKAYGHGIGIHAGSRLQILAGREFRRFRTHAGLQDGVAAAGRVVFRVYGDARLLHETTPLAAGAAPAAIDVDVAGVDVLELVADAIDAAPGAATPAVAWADARLR